MAPRHGQPEFVVEIHAHPLLKIAISERSAEPARRERGTGYCVPNRAHFKPFRPAPRGRSGLSPSRPCSLLLIAALPNFHARVCRLCEMTLNCLLSLSVGAGPIPS